MSDYSRTSVFFTSKDGLATGNPNKLVRGSEFDTEFNAVKEAVNSKADKAAPTFTGTSQFAEITASSDLTVSGTTTLAGTLAGTFTINGGTF